ncbi:MAG: response regulator, partial [Candidatus Omnitrophica bacterium]|nr:response regulator [Candidatus Omnitrophota bacterium]
TFIMEFPVLTLEEEVLQKEAMRVRANLYSSFWHDLNNDLTVVTFIEMIAMRAKEPELCGRARELRDEFLRIGELTSGAQERRITNEEAIAQIPAPIQRINALFAQLEPELRKIGFGENLDTVAYFIRHMNKALAQFTGVYCTGNFSAPTELVDAVSAIERMQDFFAHSKRFFQQQGISADKIEMLFLSKGLLPVRINPQAFNFILYNILNTGLESGTWDSQAKRAIHVSVDLNERSQELVVSFRNNYFRFTDAELQLQDLGRGECGPAILKWQAESSSPLAASHRVASLFAARITVENHKAGSFVRLLMPYFREESLEKKEARAFFAAKEPGKSSPASAAAAPGRPNVLVVEDEEMQLKLFRDMLPRCNIWGAANARDAFEALQKIKESGQDFALGIFDVSLPRCPGTSINDGVALVEAVRKMGRTFPILLSTGHSAADERFVRLKEEGKIAGVLHKVMRMEEKLAQIESALGFSCSAFFVKEPMREAGLGELRLSFDINNNKVVPSGPVREGQERAVAFLEGSNNGLKEMFRDIGMFYTGESVEVLFTARTPRLGMVDHNQGLIILHWSIVTRAPPLLARLTFTEEVLHTFMLGSDELVHLSLQNYTTNPIHAEEYSVALEQAKERGIIHVLGNSEELQNIEEAIRSVKVMVGVPKELTPHEGTVGLTPRGVRELKAAGVHVLVESGAGMLCGFSDAAYGEAGAEIVRNGREVWQRSTVIVKVKAPSPEEYLFIKPEHIIFAYFNLEANEGLARHLLSVGPTALEYHSIIREMPPARSELARRLYSELVERMILGHIKDLALRGHQAILDCEKLSAAAVVLRNKSPGRPEAHAITPEGMLRASAAYEAAGKPGIARGFRALAEELRALPALPAWRDATGVVHWNIDPARIPAALREQIILHESQPTEESAIGLQARVFAGETPQEAIIRQFVVSVNETVNELGIARNHVIFDPAPERLAEANRLLQEKCAALINLVEGIRACEPLNIGNDFIVAVEDVFINSFIAMQMVGDIREASKELPRITGHAGVLEYLVSCASLNRLIDCWTPGRLILRPEVALVTLRRYGDGLNGRTIFGQEIRRWAQEHYLFLREHPRLYPKPGEDVDYAAVLRQYKTEGYARHTLHSVEEFVMRQAARLGQEERTQQWIDNLREAARANHVPQVDYLTGARGPHAARGTASPLHWAARIACFEGAYLERLGRLFGEAELDNMRLADLPVWPVDQEGNIRAELLAWAAERNKAPPFEYYSARKLSLWALLPKRQLELFPGEGQASGCAIEPQKIECASLVGVVAVILVLAAWAFLRDPFCFAIGILYVLGISITPILLAHNIQYALHFGYYFEYCKKKPAQFGLIRPFAEAENIRAIEDRVEGGDAKGKISYFSYTLEEELRKGRLRGIQSALFANKEALRYIRKSYQWMIYFHEWIHGNRVINDKLRVKKELVAVPLTFCLPMAILGLVILAATGWFLKDFQIVFLIVLIGYNIAVPAFCAAVASSCLELRVSPAGHELLAIDRWGSLSDSQIDEIIKDYAHRATRNESTGVSLYWRDWLTGGRDEANVELIECPGRPEDILVVKATYEPHNGNLAEIAAKMSLSKKRSFVLVIVDNGPDGLTRKDRRDRIRGIVKEGKRALKTAACSDMVFVRPTGRFVKIELRSSVHDLTRLRELLKLYAGRLSRIEHENIGREAVMCEVHGYRNKLESLLVWLHANGYKFLVGLGDYMKKPVSTDCPFEALEAIDLIRQHIEMGRTPELTCLMGRSEHALLQAMLGHDFWTDKWPDLLEGPAVIGSLRKLAARLPDGEPQQQEEIREAKRFEQVLENIIRKQGKRVTPKRLAQEYNNWYRLHPKLLSLVAFMVDRFRFVYYEDKHHNIYLIGAIPENCRWRGIKGIEAFGRMEEEFREGAKRGLRLLVLMSQIWHLMNIARDEDIDERQKCIHRVMGLIQKEMELNCVRELIPNVILEKMIEVLAGEQKDEHLSEIFARLSDRLKESTRPLPEIFELLFPKEDKIGDSPFMGNESSGLETAQDSDDARQARRIDLGANTVITPACFKDGEALQTLGLCRIFNKRGDILLLDVNALVRGQAVPPRIFISARESEKAHSMENKSLEGVTREKIRKVKAILDNYDFLIHDIRQHWYNRLIENIKYLLTSPLTIFSRSPAALGLSAFFGLGMKGPENNHPVILGIAVLVIFTAAAIMLGRRLKSQAAGFPLADVSESLEENCFNQYLCSRGHSATAQRLIDSALRTPGFLCQRFRIYGRRDIVLKSPAYRSDFLHAEAGLYIQGAMLKLLYELPGGRKIYHVSEAGTIPFSTVNDANSWVGAEIDEERVKSRHQAIKGLHHRTLRLAARRSAGQRVARNLAALKYVIRTSAIGRAEEIADFIDRGNESAACAILSSLSRQTAQMRKELLRERLKAVREEEKIHEENNGEITIRLGGRRPQAHALYRWHRILDRVFASLAADYNRMKDFYERTSRLAGQLEELVDFPYARDSAGELKIEIGYLIRDLRRVKVENKKDCRRDLETALELLAAGNTKLASESLGASLPFIDLRLDSIDGMIRNLTFLRQDLRQLGERRFNRVIRRAEEVKGIFSEGRPGEAGEGLSKMLHWPFLKETEFPGLTSLVSRTAGMIRSATTKIKADKAREHLGLIVSAMEESILVSRFMRDYQGLLNDVHLNKVRGYSDDEAVFISVFRDWLAKSNLIKGSPRYWRARLYKAAFISERSHCFTACDTLLFLIKVDHFGRLIPSLKKNKRTNLLKTVFSYLMRKPGISCAKSIPVNERNAFLIRLLEAARKDYKLDEKSPAAEIAALYKAFQITPPEAVNTGFFDNLFPEDILKLESILQYRPDLIQPYAHTMLTDPSYARRNFYFHVLPDGINGLPLIYIWARTRNSSGIDIFLSEYTRHVLMREFFSREIAAIEEGHASADKIHSGRRFRSLFIAIAMHEHSRINGASHAEAISAQRSVVGYRRVGKRLEHLQETVRLTGVFSTASGEEICFAAQSLAGRATETWLVRHRSLMPMLAAVLVSGICENELTRKTIFDSLLLANQRDFLIPEVLDYTVALLRCPAVSIEVKRDAARFLGELNLVTADLQFTISSILHDCLLEADDPTLQILLLRALGNLFDIETRVGGEVYSDIMWMLRFIAVSGRCRFGYYRNLGATFHFCREKQFGEKAQEEAFIQLAAIFRRGVNFLKAKLNDDGNIFNSGNFERAHRYFNGFCNDLSSVLDSGESPFYSQSPAVRRLAATVFREAVAEWSAFIQFLAANGHSGLMTPYAESTHKFILLRAKCFVYGSDAGRLEEDIRTRLILADMLTDYGGLNVSEKNDLSRSLIEFAYGIGSDCYLPRTIGVLRKLDSALGERLHRCLLPGSASQNTDFSSANAQLTRGQVERLAGLVQERRAIDTETDLNYAIVGLAGMLRKNGINIDESLFREAISGYRFYLAPISGRHVFAGQQLGKEIRAFIHPDQPEITLLRPEEEKHATYEAQVASLAHEILSVALGTSHKTNARVEEVLNHKRSGLTWRAKREIQRKLDMRLAGSMPAIEDLCSEAGVAPAAKKKILVTDDEPVIARTYKMVLEMEGYAVKTALNADEALKIFGEEEFDLVITDLCMPNKDGGALAKEIKARNKGVPVIAITGFKPKDFDCSAIDEVMMKPVTNAELTGKVKVWLERAPVASDSTHPLRPTGMFIEAFKYLFEPKVAANFIRVGWQAAIANYRHFRSSGIRGSPILALQALFYKTAESVKGQPYWHINQNLLPRDIRALVAIHEREADCRSGNKAIRDSLKLRTALRRMGEKDYAHRFYSLKELFNVAATLGNEGKLIEAFALLQAILNAVPDFAAAYLNLGTLYDELWGDKEEAVANWAKALGLSSDAALSAEIDKLPAELKEACLRLAGRMSQEARPLALRSAVYPEFRRLWEAWEEVGIDDLKKLARGIKLYEFIREESYEEERLIAAGEATLEEWLGWHREGVIDAATGECRTMTDKDRDDLVRVWSDCRRAKDNAGERHARYNLEALRGRKGIFAMARVGRNASCSDYAQETIQALKNAEGDPGRAAAELGLGSREAVWHRINRIKLSGDASLIQRLTDALIRPEKLPTFTAGTLRVLEEAGGLLSKAAHSLGLLRSTLLRRIRIIRQEAGRLNDSATLDRLDELLSRGQEPEGEEQGLPAAQTEFAQQRIGQIQRTAARLEAKLKRKPNITEVGRQMKGFRDSPNPGNSLNKWISDHNLRPETLGIARFSGEFHLKVNRKFFYANIHIFLPPALSKKVRIIAEALPISEQRKIAMVSVDNETNRLEIENDSEQQVFRFTYPRPDGEKTVSELNTGDVTGISLYSVPAFRDFYDTAFSIPLVAGAERERRVLEHLKEYGTCVRQKFRMVNFHGRLLLPSFYKFHPRRIMVYRDRENYSRFLVLADKANPDNFVGYEWKGDTVLFLRDGRQLSADARLTQGNALPIYYAHRGPSFTVFDQTLRKIASRGIVYPGAGRHAQAGLGYGRFRFRVNVPVEVISFEGYRARVTTRDDKTRYPVIFRLLEGGEEIRIAYRDAGVRGEFIVTGLTWKDGTPVTLKGTSFNLSTIVEEVRRGLLPQVTASRLLLETFDFRVPEPSVGGMVYPMRCFVVDEAARAIVKGGLVDPATFEPLEDSVQVFLALSSSLYPQFRRLWTAWQNAPADEKSSRRHELLEFIIEKSKEEEKARTLAPGRRVSYREWLSWHRHGVIDAATGELKPLCGLSEAERRQLYHVWKASEDAYQLAYSIGGAIYSDLSTRRAIALFANSLAVRCAAYFHSRANIRAFNRNKGVYAMATVDGALSWDEGISFVKWIKIMHKDGVIDMLTGRLIPFDKLTEEQMDYLSFVWDSCWQAYKNAWDSARTYRAGPQWRHKVALAYARSRHAESNLRVFERHVGILAMATSDSDSEESDWAVRELSPDLACTSRPFKPKEARRIKEALANNQTEITGFSETWTDRQRKLCLVQRLREEGLFKWANTLEGALVVRAPPRSRLAKEIRKSQRMFSRQNKKIEIYALNARIAKQELIIILPKSEKQKFDFQRLLVHETVAIDLRDSGLGYSKIHRTAASAERVVYKYLKRGWTPRKIKEELLLRYKDYFNLRKSGRLNCKDFRSFLYKDRDGFVQTLENRFVELVGKEQAKRLVAQGYSKLDYYFALAGINIDVDSAAREPAFSDLPKEKVAAFAQEADVTGYRSTHDGLRRVATQALDSVLPSLTEREQMMLQERFGLEGGKPLSIAQIAKNLRLCPERVLQIINKAFRKLGHPVRLQRLFSIIEEEVPNYRSYVRS